MSVVFTERDHATFKSQHIDEGDLLYIPGTKRFWRADVLRLKSKREQLRRSA